MQVLLHPIFQPLHLERLVLPLPALPTLSATLIRPALGAREVTARAGFLQTVAKVELAVDEQALVIVHRRHLIAVWLLTVSLGTDLHYYEQFIETKKCLCFPDTCILAHYFGVVGVLLSPRPARLSGIKLAEEGSRLLPVLLGPERAAHRRWSTGVAAVVLGNKKAV